MSVRLKSKRSQKEAKNYPDFFSPNVFETEQIMRKGFDLVNFLLKKHLI